MRLAALILSVLLAVTACGGEQGAVTEVADITPGEAEMLIEADPDLLVLDVRTPDEFAAGHLPGAVNIDFYADDFASRLDALPKDQPVLLYCRSGNRSGQALTLMTGLGFADIRHMNGGWNGWSAAGLPAE